MLEKNQEQPSLQGLVQRMGQELNAKAVLLLHESGQVLHRSGWVEDADYPPMAALVSAMIAAGRQLSSLGENFVGTPRLFSCDSERMGLYTVAVSPEIWLAVLYEQPLNPGQFRMRVRTYSQELARLGVQLPGQWELGSGAEAGASLPPVSPQTEVSEERITGPKSSLFNDITDEEIENLFENARS